MYVYIHICCIDINTYSTYALLVCSITNKIVTACDSSQFIRLRIVSNISYLMAAWNVDKCQPFRYSTRRISLCVVNAVKYSLITIKQFLHLSLENVIILSTILSFIRGVKSSETYFNLSQLIYKKML